MMKRYEVLVDADAHGRLKALKRLTGMPVQVAASDLIREGLDARAEFIHRETHGHDSNGNRVV